MARVVRTRTTAGPWPRAQSLHRDRDLPRRHHRRADAARVGSAVSCRGDGDGAGFFGMEGCHCAAIRRRTAVGGPGNIGVTGLRNAPGVGESVFPDGREPDVDVVTRVRSRGPAVVRVRERHALSTVGCLAVGSRRCRASGKGRGQGHGEQLLDHDRVTRFADTGHGHSSHPVLRQAPPGPTTPYLGAGNWSCTSRCSCSLCVFASKRDVLLSIGCGGQRSAEPA